MPGPIIPVPITAAVRKRVFDMQLIVSGWAFGGQSISALLQRDDQGPVRLGPEIHQHWSVLAFVVPDHVAGFALANRVFLGGGVGALVAAVVQKDNDLIGFPDIALAGNAGCSGVTVVTNSSCFLFSHARLRAH